MVLDQCGSSYNVTDVRSFFENQDIIGEQSDTQATRRTFSELKKRWVIATDGRFGHRRENGESGFGSSRTYCRIFCGFLTFALTCRNIARRRLARVTRARHNRAERLDY